MPANLTALESASEIVSPASTGSGESTLAGKLNINVRGSTVTRINSCHLVDHV